MKEETKAKYQSAIVIYVLLIVVLLIGLGYAIEHWTQIWSAIVYAAVFVWEKTTLLTWIVGIGLVLVLDSLSAINDNLRSLNTDLEHMGEQIKEINDAISAELEERR